MVNNELNTIYFCLFKTTKKICFGLMLCYCSFSMNFVFAGQILLTQSDIDLKGLKGYTYEDFEHPNKGCLENSWCDPEMGKQHKKWMIIIEKLAATKTTEKMRTEEIENFRKTHGLPVQFYARKQSMELFNPMLWTSSCTFHQSKEKPDESVYYGLAFLKDTKEKKANIVKLEKNFQIDIGPEIQLDPVIVYHKNKKTEYLLPRGEVPLYIKNNNAYLLREEEGVYYLLQISTSGEWKVVMNTVKTNQRAIANNEESECPKDEAVLLPEFKSFYCKKVWDEDSKQTLTMKLQWSC